MSSSTTTTTTSEIFGWLSDLAVKLPTTAQTWSHHDYHHHHHSEETASLFWSTQPGNASSSSSWLSSHDVVSRGYDWLFSFSELPHTWSTETRDPLFTFEWKGQELGFYSMSVLFWAEMLLIMVFEAFVAVAFSVLVYNVILKRQGSKLSYLLGYGIIIPFWVLFPSMVIDGLGVRNKIYRFCMAAVTPTLCVFRTTEAMHGFSPPHAIQSLKSFAVYFGSPMVARVDKHSGEFIQASNTYLLQQFWLVVRSFVFLGFLYSIFLLFPHHFPQFDIDYDEDEWYSLRYAFSKKNVQASVFYTAIFQNTLSTSGDGGNFVTSLITGYEMEPFMTNPMFESKTMAEFWGKRWNKLIQTLLKRGIFKPLRSLLPKYAAMAVTFAVSGIFHEWLMMVIFAPLPDQLSDDGTCEPPKCYKLFIGSALIFFLWMGVLVAFEFLFLPRSFFKTEHKLYKLCMGSIACIGGPFFLAPYVHTPFFKEGFMGYFMVQPMESMT